MSFQKNGMQSRQVQHYSLAFSGLYRFVRHRKQLGIVGVQRRAGDQEAGAQGLVSADGAVVLRRAVYLVGEIIGSPEERTGAIGGVVVGIVNGVNSVGEQRKHIVKPRRKGIALVQPVEAFCERVVYLIVHRGVPGAQGDELVGAFAAVIRAENFSNRVVADVENTGLRRGVPAFQTVTRRACSDDCLSAADGRQNNASAAQLDMLAFYFNSHLKLPPFNAVQGAVK